LKDPQKIPKIPRKPPEDPEGHPGKILERRREEPISIA
jgi:hypothetical protein